VRSPAEIDLELARLYTERAELGARMQVVTDRIAAVLAEREGLQGRAQSGNAGDVVTSANVRVSLRAVAEAVGVSHSLLSQAHRGKRRIKRSLAEKIARLTKAMPANRTTWPLGWVDE
jgi:transcriptional regulator with XRE-family HTH domain